MNLVELFNKVISGVSCCGDEDCIHCPYKSLRGVSWEDTCIKKKNEDINSIRSVLRLLCEFVQSLK